jgi:hypothetical protein
MRVKQIRATYARLEDQSWGIRITGATSQDVMPGWFISVTKKDGTTKDEIIGRIVSTVSGQNGSVITATVRSNSADPPSVNPKEEF